MIQQLLDLVKLSMTEKPIRLLVGVAIVVGGAVYLYQREVRQPETLIANAEAQRIQAEKRTETVTKSLAHVRKHMFEQPVWTPLPNSQYSATAYKDKCLGTMYVDGDQIRTRLILPDDDDLTVASIWTWLEPVVHAQGRCLFPHWGEPAVARYFPDPCTIEDRFIWADSCWGNAFYNTCSGAIVPFTWRGCVH